jgi:hypothetical protein
VSGGGASWRLSSTILYAADVARYGRRTLSGVGCSAVLACEPTARCYLMLPKYANAEICQCRSFQSQLDRFMREAQQAGTIDVLKFW